MSRSAARPRRDGPANEAAALAFQPGAGAGFVKPRRAAAAARLPRWPRGRRREGTAKRHKRKPVQNCQTGMAASPNRHTPSGANSPSAAFRPQPTPPRPGGRLVAPPGTGLPRWANDRPAPPQSSSGPNRNPSPGCAAIVQRLPRPALAMAGSDTVAVCRRGWRTSARAWWRRDRRRMNPCAGRALASLAGVGPAQSVREPMPRRAPTWTQSS